MIWYWVTFAVIGFGWIFLFQNLRLTTKKTRTPPQFDDNTFARELYWHAVRCRQRDAIILWNYWNIMTQIFLFSARTYSN